MKHFAPPEPANLHNERAGNVAATSSLVSFARVTAVTVPSWRPWQVTRQSETCQAHPTWHRQRRGDTNDPVEQE
jgi:hypothetical protein